MAGMFYSLEEAAKKLGKTEEEVKLLATEGKLREFRDGSIVMFKIDEVEALVAEAGLEPAEEEDLSLDAELSTDTDDLEQFLDLDSLEEESDLAEEAPAESLEVDETPESELELEPAAEFEDLEEDLLMSESEPEPELEPVAEAEEPAEPTLEPEPEPEAELEPLEGLEDVEEEFALEPEAEAEELPELREDLDALLGLAETEEAPEEEAVTEESALEAEPEEDLIMEEELGLAESGIDMTEPGDDLADDTLVAAEAETPDGGDASQEDLLLEEASELTDMDTALTGEGISVLGESDADFKLTDDTLAETLAGLGATGETSLEEIEDDISLDSFGSGSGLLDLSLQADDTSLGGILDEIYTTEEEGGDAGDNLGTAEEVTAEADSLISESKLEATVEDDFTPAMVMGPRAVAELPPDSSSNLLGALLFLPLILLLFTTLVALAGLGEFSPPLVGSIAGFVWYIMGGLAVVGLVVGIVGMVGGGGGGGPKPKKVKKKKEPKQPKPKKEKKPKVKKEKKKKK